MKRSFWQGFLIIFTMTTAMAIPCLLPSCSKSNYLYEEMVLIDTENSNKVSDVYSFDKWQVAIIKRTNPYIPERAEINYVDRKGFVYFTLSNKTYAVKFDSMNYSGVVVYPLSDSKKRR